MSITRKLLKGMGLTEEQVDTIIEEHSRTVDGLKDQIDGLKEDAGKLADVQKELDKAREALETGKKESWKVKYDALKEEYDTYKGDQEKKESRAAKETAFRALLKKIGISEKRIDAIVKVSDVDSVELDDKGAIKDEKDREKGLKEEWADFITTQTTKGAKVDNPAGGSGTGGTMTKEEIMKIRDSTQRQAAMKENPGLFGIATE